VGSETVLETEDLTKEFAGFVAVRSVNLRVARGSIHALIGPNGAGKTTCLQSAEQVPAADPRPHRL
jgi:branched-chain amino acid transport system ATP-binding protein